jgi:glycosyltransferase involved in cell wall biosynthesis
MVKISVAIITFNEEKNIGRCIDSVRPVADEILVVDSYSKDETKKICLEKGVRLIEHAFEGHIQQKNFALSQTVYDHVLSIDADEYLSPELTKSIMEAKLLWPADAYTMNRLSSYGGRWMKLSAWYPDKKLRLWDKKIGNWGGDNPHDKVIVERRTNIMHLNGDLMHQAYENATEFLTKVQSYSEIFASEKRFIIRSSPFKVFYKTAYTFFYNFFIKLGIFGGFEGAMISLSNTNYTFYKYSKLLEANKSLKISLILTNYNKKTDIEAVLNSIVKQWELPDELIIEESQVNEDMQELVRQYQSLLSIPIIHSYNGVPSRQSSDLRHKAISTARNECIIIVDDAVSLPVNFIKAHKKCAWKGQFINGLLGSKSSLEEETKEQVAINSNSPNTSTKTLSFWKEDLIKGGETLNSYDDLHSLSQYLAKQGISRKNLKFTWLDYHFYWPKKQRNELVYTEPTVKLVEPESGLSSVKSTPPTAETVVQKTEYTEKTTASIASNLEPFRFSIFIPTWNNLKYLQLCIQSIRKNSTFPHQIIVHVNEGRDGTLDWIAQQKDIEFTHSPTNVGVCYALNSCRTLAKEEYLVFINDDMYLCPDWDSELINEIRKIGHKYFFLSSTPIEPIASSNCVIEEDYGRDVTTFNEEKLLREFNSLSKEDWFGATWPPNIVHKELWDLVGGYSIEYTPGMYSDPDFSMKLWKAGVRIFKGISKSRAYHFGSKSVKRVKKNPGYYTFINKWGFTSSTLSKYYLKRGEPVIGVLTEPTLGPNVRIKNFFKRVLSSI